VKSPFKLLTIEREYSIPEIPNPWSHKVQLTTTEVGAFIQLYGNTVERMNIDRQNLLRIGVEFTPIREMIRLSKNYYVILALPAQGAPSINIINHWSWNREKKKDVDEYVNGLFIPSIFAEETMKRVDSAFKDKDNA